MTVADEVVTQYGGKIIGWLVGVIIFLGGVSLAGLRWIGGRAQLRQDDHEIRIQKLERETATKSDIDSLRADLTAAAININEEIGEAKLSVEKGHNKIMELLLQQKDAR